MDREIPTATPVLGSGGRFAVRRAVRLPKAADEHERGIGGAHLMD